MNGQSFATIGYELDGIDNRDAILGLIVLNHPLERLFAGGRGDPRCAAMLTTA